MNTARHQPWVLQFSEVNKSDLAAVGGKGANLGEMTQAGFPVPPGFIITAQAYYYFLKQNELKERIAKDLYLLTPNDPENLQRITARIRQLIISTPVPQDLGRIIVKAYDALTPGLVQAHVAVRSSATAEDLPGASFAGQQETYLNIKGEASVIEHVRMAWASLFTPRATFYRAEKGFDHFKVGIAVPVQKMIQSEVSGVMFTINPAKNDKRQIVVEAIYGLGELIVQGAVTPDHYEVDKQNMVISDKVVSSQSVMLVKKDGKTEQRPVPSSRQKLQKLPDKLILEVADYGKKLQQHYFYPQDVEWAVEDEKVYIIQTRPVTTIENVAAKQRQAEDRPLGLPEILHGQAASPGLVSGKAKVINSAAEIAKVEQGEILVTKMTTPDFVPAMRRVVAIVTDEGGLTSHAAIVSRELGVTCVVGTNEATSKIKTGQLITVDGAKGVVYDGKTDLSSKKFKALSLKAKPKMVSDKGNKIKTATKLFVNLAEPEAAKKVSRMDVDGIGLLRAEFMIAQIGTHPKRLIAQGKSKLFIQKLADGLIAFARAFSPRPIIYRSTDFKTNEYGNLVGGKEFEPDEENPMIGFRGAYRYLLQPDVFELELEAIKQVRHKHGYRNLHLMLPFVRTIKELNEAKKLLAVNGLMRTPTFRLYMMVEIPSNVISLQKFIECGIDGVSIGSNDLTQLILGIDRDNQEVAPEFSEMDPAVLWAIRRTIRIAHKYKIHSSICGQAPSIYPQLTEKLVRWGISAISVTPDTLGITRQLIAQAEHKLITRK